VLARLREALAPPPYRGARWTARRLLNFYRVQWEESRGRVRLKSRPIKLTVEATSACNLGCPACFTGVGEVGRPRGGMSLDLYRRLLAELGPYLFEVEFYNWGEPLLHKPIFTMIEETHRRGIATTVSTNLSFPWDAERAERLVASGLSVLGVSIDGARQETYAQYRVGGDLDLVLRNCRLVADAKRRLGASLRFIWEFHAFPHNLDDIPAAHALADELGMEFIPSKGWVVGEEWDPESPHRFLWIPTSPRRCWFLWRQAVVNNDGGVAPCCGTFYREDDMGQLAVRAGDVGEQSFAEIWNGERFRTARGFYRRYEAGGEAAKRICFACPATKAWDKWIRHQAAGGGPSTFDPGYTPNEAFNFFFDRRPDRTTARVPSG
jgi:MoaA/NifB/PqqE/SkfB family radical SAM enzyme